MEALASAATLAQLLSFTGEVLVAGYSFLWKVQKAPSEIRSLLRETEALNAILDQLQDLANDNGNPSSRDSLKMIGKLGCFEDCMSLMRVIKKSIKACGEVKGEKVRNFGKRVAWPFKEKETKDMMAQLRRMREILSAAAAVDSVNSLRHLEIMVSRVEGKTAKVVEDLTQLTITTETVADAVADANVILNAQIEKDQRVAIRRWLHPDWVDSEVGLTSALRQKCADTGKWFLESKEFHQWLLTPDSRMWLYGIAGCGKTVLSATVIHHLLHELHPLSPPESSRALYFFCDHRDPSKLSFQDMLYVLSKQLLDMDLSCFEAAKHWHDERKRETSVATPLGSQDYIALIRQMCSRWGSVSLIVDALDECDNLDLFVNGLEELTIHSNIRLLLTSRHDVKLARVIAPMVHHELSVAANMGDDIETFLASEINKRIETGVLKLRQRNLGLWILHTLKEKADGMILIAKLQLEYICGLKSDRDIKEGLAKLPSSIYATYDQILGQIYSRRPNDVDDIRKILQWLTYSKVPLTLEQIAEVISIRAEDRMLDESGIATDPLDLAASLGSLITLHTQDTDRNAYEDLRGSRITLISLAHYSVEEYLKAGRIGSDVPELPRMSAKMAHQDIAKICLQYISFEDFGYPIARPSFSKIGGSMTLFAERRLLRKRTAVFALYDYACRYWAEHLRESDLDLNDEMESLLDWFLQPHNHQGKYISWQQMYHHDIVYYCPGRPPLHYAIEFNIQRLVSKLLPPNESVDKLARGVSPLHVAARCGALETVHNLLALGASIDIRSAPDRRKMTAEMTPLHFAAEGGHTQVIQLLLEHGASPHSKNASGSTPFSRAARSGSIQAMKVLYGVGSDINTAKHGMTPLFEAIGQCRPRVACQLLHWGADPTIVTDEGETALSLLAQSLNRNFWDSTTNEGGFSHLESFVELSAPKHRDYNKEATLGNEVFKLPAPRPKTLDLDDNSEEGLITYQNEGEPELWLGSHKQLPGQRFTEYQILEEIRKLQSSNSSREDFAYLVRDLKRHQHLLKQMDKDTRPGTEREKDYRYGPDPRMIITVSDFYDKEDA